MLLFYLEKFNFQRIITNIFFFYCLTPFLDHRWICNLFGKKAHCCLWPHHIWISVALLEGFFTWRSWRCWRRSCIFTSVSHKSFLLFLLYIFLSNISFEEQRLFWICLLFISWNVTFIFLISYNTTRKNKTLLSIFLCNFKIRLVVVRNGIAYQIIQITNGQYRERVMANNGGEIKMIFI